MHLSNGLRLNRGTSGDKIFVNSATCKQYNTIPNPDGLGNCLRSTTSSPAAQTFGSRHEETYQCINSSYIMYVL